MGAEKLIVAQKKNKKIIVEVKSFISPSEIHDLQQAVGQYIMYQDILIEQRSSSKLYLAVPEVAYNGIFSTEIGQLILNHQNICLIVFDEVNEVITQWITE